MKDGAYYETLNEADNTWSGKAMVTLGNAKDKMTVSMVAAHRHFPEANIEGCETFEQGAARVLDPTDHIGALIVPCLYPGLSGLWADLKMDMVFTDEAAAFVYGQFGEGLPDYLVTHPAAERFAKRCPKAKSLEYVDANDKAPQAARTLHQELGKTVGFITAEFIAKHYASDRIVKVVCAPDPLPFVVLKSRYDD